MAQAKNKEEFDKYYTNDDIAKMIISKLPNDKTYLIVEPSAGDGAFIKYLTTPYIAMDIKPQHPNITQQDYLLYTHNSTQPTITLMNPPFGTGCNLAIKFFNKAAEYSEYIYWIAPRTMLKKSKENKLSLEFTCIHSEVLPEKAFHLPDGTQKAVRTVFQIWKKQKREPHILKYALTANKDWEFCKITDDWDFILRVHGYNAGKIVGQNKTNFKLKLGPKSNIYDENNFVDNGLLKCIKCNIDPEIVFNRFDEIYEDIKKTLDNCMGPKNLSICDLIEFYEKRYSNKPDWEFCKINDDWDFVLRLHGYSAGKIVGQSKTNFEYTLLGPRTKIYDKALAEKEVNIPLIKCNIDPEIVFNRFSEMYADLKPLIENSMGPDDLHRDDIIRCYEKRYMLK